MRCSIHPDHRATDRCGVCGAFFCADCLSPSPIGDPVCPTCAPSLERHLGSRPSRPSPGRYALGAIAIVAIGSALATMLLLSQGTPDEPRGDVDPRNLRAAWSALEETGLALELFKLREGRYPDSLDELLPVDLAELPRDPFGRGGAPLVYAQTRGGPELRLLYSVGPDRLDQRGSPFDPVDRRGDLVYPVH